MAKAKKQTRDENRTILERYAEYDDVALVPSVPPNRLLKVGDEIEIGNLEDCVVVEISEDGRIVLVDYTRVDNNYGNPIRNEHVRGVWNWLSCFKKSDETSTRFAREKRIQPVMINTSLDSLLNIVLCRGTRDNPDYQRDYVWTLSDKEALIDSVFNERNIGTFLFVEYPFAISRGHPEIMDGKQRLAALKEFVCSGFTYREKFYHELSRRDRNIFNSVPIQYAMLDGKNLSRSDLLQIFLDVNHAGVPQTEDHLNKVRGLLNEELKMRD